MIPVGVQEGAGGLHGAGGDCTERACERRGLYYSGVTTKFNDLHIHSLEDNQLSTERR